MRLIKILLATGTFLFSFSLATYLISSYAARHSEQKQDDFINGTVGTNVVEITDLFFKKGGGTGFFVKTPKGNSFILTNNHVCGLANEANAVLIDGEYYSYVVARFSEHDLCLLSNPLNREGIEVARESRQGQNVYVVGHPVLEPKALIKGQISGDMSVQIILGYNLPCEGKYEHKIDLTNTLASLFGYQSACMRSYEAQATTLNILPGNSGSPVVDMYGQVVGVAFAASTEAPGRGYIIPLSYVQKFLAEK